MPSRTKLRRPLTVTTLEDRLTPTTLPAGFNEQVIATGIHSPTAMTLTPDGRILVAEQNGAIRIIQGNTILPEPLLDINTPGGGEGGLVGLTLDPNFATNGYFYAYYLVPSVNGSAEFNRVSRFTATGNSASLSSELILLDLDPIVAPAGSYTHNGGAMHFGLDGKLYIATGDNVDPPSSQSLSLTRGKILRINSDGTIPADNPTSFQGVSGTTSGKYRSIYALGLRNPFTFDVDPASGRIFINDVGQDAWEEINSLQAGKNYGWPGSEGATANPAFTGPVYTYQHGIGDEVGLAITGGTFYSPASKTFGGSYSGDYFFADFVSNWIKTYDVATGAVTMFAKDLTRGGVIDLDVTANGDLLYLARGDDGTDAGIYRISKSNAPAIAQQPGGRRMTVGESVNLSVQANGAGPLRYQWTRNGFDIRGANSAFFKVTARADDDQASYRVVVTNDFGTVVSAAAVLTVTQTQPPTATITSPSADHRFFAGETITATGVGFDPDTGNLPSSVMTWKVDYFTGTASRPFVTDTVGESVTFTVPTLSPYTLPDIFYRITLTVKDPSGYEAVAVRDVLPQTAVITVAASVPGVDVLLDGQPVGQIHTFTGVAGLQRQLAVPASIVHNGETLPFLGWFDGDTNTNRLLSTPSESGTLLAIYKRSTKVTNEIAVGTGPGNGPLVKTFDEQGNLKTQFFAFDTAQRSGVSVVSADFTGDNIPDIAAGTGAGTAPQVAIFDGATGLKLKTIMVFEDHFLGGVGVNASDFDNDGQAELIVTPGFGGGPRVRILHPNNGGTVADFFGIADTDFRGGARASAGDITGDGTPDLVVSAGDGGGPRIAGWDGTALLGDHYTRVFDDFFAFDAGLRGGAFVSVGELTGDGFADIVLGAGTGGGPHILVKSGANFQPGVAGGVASSAAFFAEDTTARGGVKVLARDLDGDGDAEIIATTSNGGVPQVDVFDSSGTKLEGWDAFAENIPGGVFVG